MKAKRKKPRKRKFGDISLHAVDDDSGEELPSVFALTLNAENYGYRCYFNAKVARRIAEWLSAFADWGESQ